MGYYGDRDLVKRARELRKTMTKAEIILWSKIRSRQLDGNKFRRQQPIFNYIVDFYCNELKLIIEIDGEIHTLAENKRFDKIRDNLLKLNGYHILRLSNSEVETDLAASIQKIKSFIIEDLSPSKGDHRGSANE